MAKALILPPLAIAGAAASSTATGYSAAYVANDYAGVVWQSNGDASPWLRIDLGADVSVDTVALFGLVGISAGSTLRIDAATAAQGSGFGAGAFVNVVAPGTIVLAGTAAMTGGRGIGLFPFAPVTCRYLLITFSSVATSIQVARAVVGRRFTPERNFAYGGGPGVRDLGSLDFNRRGVLNRVRGARMRTVQLTFSNLRRDEVEASVRPLLEALGSTEMLGLFTDPAPDTQRMNRAYFGPLVGDLSIIQRNALAFEAKVNVVSIF